MNTTKSTEAKFKLTNFNFDTREVNLIHSQFSGERTQFISTVDELLRCWAMADSANPKIQFDYSLMSRLQDGKAIMREQSYSAAHVSVFFQLISKPMEMIPGIALKDSTQLITLYDQAFAAARPDLPAHTVASYFSLRAFVARIAEYTTMVDIEGTLLTIFIVDDKDDHLAVIDLKLFGQLSSLAEQLNAAVTVE